MDPAVKRYFQKIVSSFSMGLLWMFSLFTIGLYFRLALVEGSFQWYNAVFYLGFVISFALLIRFYYRLWSRADFAETAEGQD